MLERRVIGSELEYAVMVAMNEPDKDTPENWKPDFVIPSVELLQGIMRFCLPSTIQGLDERLDARFYSVGSMNSNGSRGYVDCGHPEMCTAEVTSPLQLVAHDIGNDRILTQTFDRAVKRGHINHYHLSRAIADERGNTWAAHSNIQVERMHLDPSEEMSGPGGEHFNKFRLLGAHFVTAQIYTGEGGLWRTTKGLQFVQAPKMMSTTRDFTSDTVRDKPIINQRDEPHADYERFARIHKTCSSSNINPWAKRMEFGTDMLMADALEAGLEPDKDVRLGHGGMHRAAHIITTDPSCKAVVELADGTTMRAVDIQYEFLAMFKRLSDYKDFTEDDRFTIEQLEIALGALAVDPMQAIDRIEWPLKLDKMRQYRIEPSDNPNRPKRKDGGTNLLMHEEAWRIERAWARIHSGRTVADALRKQIWHPWMPSGYDIDQATVHAPIDTRAQVREQFIRSYYAIEGAMADWDYLATPNLETMYNTPIEGRRYHRISMDDPLATTHEEVTELVRAMAEYRSTRRLSRNA